MASGNEYDVIVVGSGAGGGMSCYVLTKAGFKVLLLEAGRDYDPETETPMFDIPAEAPLRGVGTPEKPFGYYDATIDGGWEVPGEPYTIAEGSEEFKWWRTRMLGGRTNHWGRISLRFGPYDFKYKSRDGLGFDWPLGYEDIAPYYDKTESLIGVSGTIEGLENTPDSSEGVLQPPPKPRLFDIMTQRGFEAVGIPAIAAHTAVLTQPLNGRAACIYATPCGRGCSIKANFQSTTVLIPPAAETGNLEIRTDAMVHTVEHDDKGRAIGVTYIDRKTHERVSVRGRIVILAASACESARIMLNSKSDRFPDGLANSSGLVGKYLMDTVGTSTVGRFPVLENMPPHNDDGISTAHMYAPWWQYQEQARGELDFPRGYHIEWSGGRRMPDMNVGSLADHSEVLYGPGLRKNMRRVFGSIVGFAGRGEMIPNEDCYCEIDPVVKDKWGIPVLRFHWKWSEHEIKQAEHMRRTFVDLIERLGGEVISGGETENGRELIKKGGEIIHEIGSCKMGDTPENSVLNQYCQSWDVDNLFVMDGSSFVTNPDKNPTLTILALCWRSCDYLVDQMQKEIL